jgi:hypothetical protein
MEAMPLRDRCHLSNESILNGEFDVHHEKHGLSREEFRKRFVEAPKPDKRHYFIA